ncbi:MAG: outer membrane protein assembly factor BamC [Methylovulum sp.]|nr:outer membrane protein assembly factor BamC [Methylovulum sp.]
MKPKIVLPLITFLALNLLTGCGYVKSLFPDKEKDYQYTTEIPALVLPPDLRKDDSLKLVTRPEQPVIAEQPEATPLNVPAVEQSMQAPTAAPIPPKEVEPIAIDTPTATDTAGSTPPKHELIPVALVKSATGENILRLSVPFENAWRAIDKALSRKSIEVTDRNKAEQQFTLNYDPDEKALEDHSFWHETLFMFRGFQNNDQAFTVKLMANGEKTDVLVLDKEHKPATDASALSLLKLLQNTIQSDFAK